MPCAVQAGPGRYPAGREAWRSVAWRRALRIVGRFPTGGPPTPTPAPIPVCSATKRSCGVRTRGAIDSSSAAKRKNQEVLGESCPASRPAHQRPPAPTSARPPLSECRNFNLKGHPSLPFNLVKVDHRLGQHWGIDNCSLARLLDENIVGGLRNTSPSTPGMD